MAMNYEVVGKYLTNVIDEVLVHDSKTSMLEDDTGMLVDTDFKMAGWVKIADILLSGLGWYVNHGHTEVAGANTGNYSAYNGNNGTNARDGYPIGNASISFTLYQLRYKRGASFQIDEVDNEESANILGGKLAVDFARRSIVPEVDATRFSVIADNTNISLGNKVTETLTIDNILGNFYKGFEWLTNHGVAEDNQILFVSTSVNTLLGTTPSLTRFITQENITSGKGITLTINKFQGREIVVVPNDRFFTDISLADNGYLPSATSKQLNYLIVDKRSALGIKKLDQVRVYGPNVVSDFFGTKINFLVYHDLIVAKNKVVGLYASISGTGATGVVGGLSIATKAGAVANGTIITGLWTMPVGMAYAKIVYSASAIAKNVGEAYTGGTEVYLNTEFSASTNTSLHFAVLDSNGVIVAKSTGAIAIDKKA